MKKFSKWLSFAPLLICIFLIFILIQELYSSNSNITQSPFSKFREKNIDFTLPNLFDPSTTVTEKDFNHRIVLLNVWASWCDGCYQEHQTLMNIKNNYKIPIFGIDYKDSPQVAIKFLKRNGNPFEKIGSDPDGSVAVDLGIYGTPETFIIDQHGKIIYRHIGPITMSIWQNVLYPVIQKAKNEN